MLLNNRFPACLLMILFSSALFAADATVELIGFLEKIKSFQAHFSQSIHDANGESVIDTKGVMKVERPGKFYWKSEAPDSIIIVADGTHLWTYDVELSQVTKQQEKPALNNSPATLLAGSLDIIKKNYTITYAKPGQCRKAQQCYFLRHKQKDGGISDILIGVNKGQLTEIRIHDSLGQDICTVFTQVQTNKPINNKVFTFNPPKGVDIIQGGR